MRNLLLFSTVATLLLTSGCLISLHPLYTSDVIEYRPELLGTWEVPYKFITMTFEPMPDKRGYQLTYRDKKNESESGEHYQVHLLRLGDHHFIDFYPDLSKMECRELSLAAVLPTHGFARIEFTGRNEFTLHFFDIEWLETLFQQRRIRLQHEVTEDELIVLTAPSEELQKFVSKYADDPQAYIDDPTIVKKRFD